MVLSSVIWSKKKDDSLLESYKKFEEEKGGLKNLIINPGNGSNPSKFVTKSTCSTIFCFNQIIMINSTSDYDHDYFYPPNYCFLKSCHLCHKPLKLDKEVYMYRGDLGFCSVECRERQMYMDEMKELEIFTKKLLMASTQRRRDRGAWCETSHLATSIIFVPYLNKKRQH